ncbi:hypothetical protein AX17_002651 [Amanita inopinata Kibby_2008]|nr:hypothetical protein AX17_002651 [Amanita inopinata Kibby_2008]
MSRIPPTLSYLTIYNPTLQPSFPVANDDDDDAEAQAHILFYTSKERAVSRDRMLRQVGLAKALVNFAELFNPDDPCRSVHSQTRRMVMVSPEPDFWIHAGIEVARSQRNGSDKSKGKAKEKAKQSAKDDVESAPVFEYYDGSIHDGAIRNLLLQGYEHFKLMHGSFKQILSTLGREALELQLERFFTIWVWSLNLEEIPDFGNHLGVPLHPLHRKITSLLDTFETELPYSATTIFVSPPYVALSSNYSTQGYPASLLRHFLALARPLQAELTSADDPPEVDTEKRQSHQRSQGSIPQQSKDMRKWYWPAYLTFGGKGSQKPTHPPELATEVLEKQKDEAQVTEPQLSEVDKNALEDAMESESLSTLSTAAVAMTGQSAPDSADATKADGHPGMSLEDEDGVLPPERLVSDILRTFVHLAEKTDSQLTRRSVIHYCVDGQHLLAVIPLEDISAVDLNPVIGKALSNFFNELDKTEDDVLLSSLDKLPSAAKILQPLDRHVVATAGLTLSDPLFVSQASYLYEAETLFDLDHEIKEVFSRGQNPQYWHIAKRDLGSTTETATASLSEVYLEIFRKESSLADVDNVLAGISACMARKPIAIFLIPNGHPMSSSSTTEAQLKSEIARLTASINQRKSSLAAQQSGYGRTARSNTYMNPKYKPYNKYIRPGSSTSPSSQDHPTPPTKPPSTKTKEVVLNGVAFESSGRSLVRKDHTSLVPKPVPASGSVPTAPRSAPVLPKRFTHKIGRPPSGRVYKPKSSRGRNMTLNNNQRPYQSRRVANKARKYSNKPCPRFTTTGACNRGLTCMYQHDPLKIAICWNFLQDNCSNTAETCNLSHDPTPERTPLCFHFLNKGRCTRERCPFPHVNVGTRHGICRDFAVLGYCEKGLNCDKQHVRECPDFAEKGTCTTKGCKLPHVIRANRNRKVAPKVVASIPEHTETETRGEQPSTTAEDAQLGDEYISLTFNESSEDESEDEDEDEDEEDTGTDDDVTEGQQQVADPTEDMS